MCWLGNLTFRKNVNLTVTLSYHSSRELWEETHPLSLIQEFNGPVNSMLANPLSSKSFQDLSLSEEL